jgi:hypothetical protein
MEVRNMNPPPASVSIGSVVVNEPLPDTATLQGSEGKKYLQPVGFDVIVKSNVVGSGEPSARAIVSDDRIRTMSTRHFTGRSQVA